MCRLCINENVYLKGLCKECWNSLPSTFNKDNIPKRVFLLTCKENHTYLSHQTNIKCPICYAIDVYCKTCNKLLDFKISKNEINNNHFCSVKCKNQFVVKNLTKAGKCTSCGIESEIRDAVGQCLECSRNKLKERKLSGTCTICGKLNEIRDQNGRGKSHCKCSSNWFLKHNTSDKMIKRSRELGLKIGRFNFPNNVVETKFCKICNKETPHNIHEHECLSCNKEYVWCNHCQKWETKLRNSVPNHWIFYKSKTKQWLKDNSNLVSYLENIIVGFNDIDNKSKICGIYCWYINNTTIYVGQSVDILSRLYDHMMYIVEFPDYWYDIINNLDNNKLEVKILEECNKDLLNNKELYWINILKPESQKCDGTDNIKPLNQRNFKL